MIRRSILMNAVVICCVALAIAACGGGGGKRSAQTPPPQQSTIGAAGGTANGPNGARVVVPANALAQNTAIAITQSSAGAPALPAGLQLASEVFAFTPHGTPFALSARVTLPYDASRVPAGITPAMYKTNAQNEWERVSNLNTSIGGGEVGAQVDSFSWFAVGFQPPQITQQPQDATAVENNAATFTVTALGNPPFRFQWQRSDDDGVTFLDIANADDNSYFHSPALASDDGVQFRVVVANSEGSTTSAAATLTVTTPTAGPTISLQPQDQTVLLDTAATFSVSASPANATYQWSRSDAGGPFANIAGATAASYTLANASLNVDNGARFQVVVSNALGRVTSTAAQLTVVASLPATGPRIAAGLVSSLARLANGQLVSWGGDSRHDLGAGPAREDRTTPGPVISVANAVSIAAGPQHGLAVLSNGTVWGWGASGFDELGSGNTGIVPEQIAGVTTAVAACAGRSHTLFRIADGRVLALGANSFGQLGDGTTSRSRATPDPVVGLQDVVAISCGAYYSLALLSDGTVRAWGRNDFGQLGNDTTTDSATPVEVSGLTDVVAISAGGTHSLAVRSDGAVWGWGANFFGEVSRLGEGMQLTPVATEGAESGYIAVAAGSTAGNCCGGVSLGLRTDGTVWAWGNNADGQFGTGSDIPFFSHTPFQVPGVTNIVEIATSSSEIGGHVLAVSASGSVWAWGQNTLGQVGNGSVSNLPAPPAPIVGLDLD